MADVSDVQCHAAQRKLSRVAEI